MKSKPMYDYEYQTKSMSTNLLKVITHDKVRQKQATLQNKLRSNNSKMAKFLADNNKPMDQKQIDLLQADAAFQEAELAQAMSGAIALYANRKRFKGIIPSGIQLELFGHPLYLEVGTEPAAVHKGGIPCAK